MARQPRRIGIVVFEGVQALDVAGPHDAFDSANFESSRKTQPYQLLILGTRKGTVRACGSLGLAVDFSLRDAPPLDTVIVPGGSGIRVDDALRREIAAWIKERAPKMRRVASVCTGTYALAEAGLLNGREATTHWRFTSDVAARWPRIRMNSDAIYTKSGRYYTSAGITAGIDLALTFIQEDLGTAMAVKVARDLVVYAKRPGGQLQYSEPLRLQELAGEKLSDTLSWMLEHLDGDLSVEALAERAHLSPRHFARKFKATFNATPADVVERLRLDHARWLLANDAASIDRLASAVGYASDDSFRRAFARRFGTAPSDYRRRFAAP